MGRAEYPDTAGVGVRICCQLGVLVGTGRVRAGREHEVEVAPVESGEGVGEVDGAVVRQRAHDLKDASFSAGQRAESGMEDVGVQPHVPVRFDPDPGAVSAGEPSIEGADQ